MLKSIEKMGDALSNNLQAMQQAVNTAAKAQGNAINASIPASAKQDIQSIKASLNKVVDGMSQAQTNTGGLLTNLQFLPMCPTDLGLKSMLKASAVAITKGFNASETQMAAAMTNVNTTIAAINSMVISGQADATALISQAQQVLLTNLAAVMGNMTGASPVVANLTNTDINYLQLNYADIPLNSQTNCAALVAGG